MNLVSFPMDNMFDEGDDEYDATHDIHREEGKSRIKLDAQDRNKVFREMETHPNPSQTYTSNIVNIYNGCVADEHVNVHNVIDIGEEMTSKLRQNLPGGFHTPLQKIVTMESLKHTVRLGDTVAVYDMEKLFGRLLILS